MMANGYDGKMGWMFLERIEKQGIAIAGFGLSVYYPSSPPQMHQKLRLTSAIGAEDYTERTHVYENFKLVLSLS